MNDWLRTKAARKKKRESNSVLRFGEFFFQLISRRTTKLSSCSRLCACHGLWPFTGIRKKYKTERCVRNSCRNVCLIDYLFRCVSVSTFDADSYYRPKSESIFQIKSECGTNGNLGQTRSNDTNGENFQLCAFFNCLPIIRWCSLSLSFPPCIHHHL